MTSSNQSAGILLFRLTTGVPEVFLVHPGGPFWVKKDAGAWSIPKGLFEPSEEPLTAAQRELTEETGFTAAPPFLPLGSVVTRSRKTIHAWASEGDADPARAVSNTFEMEWPKGSGKIGTFPEVDRWAWFSIESARAFINAGQVELLDRLEELLATRYTRKP